MVPTLPGNICTLGLCTSENGYQVDIQGFVQNFPPVVQYALSMETRSPTLPILVILAESELATLLFFFPLSTPISARTWYQYSRSSFNCINITAFFRSLSKLVVGFLHRLSTNDPGFKVVTMWCTTISGLRFWMFRDTLLYLFMKTHSDLPFSCLSYVSERYGGQMMRSTACELCPEFGNQCLKAVHRLVSSHFSGVSRPFFFVAKEARSSAQILSSSCMPCSSLIPFASVIFCTLSATRWVSIVFVWGAETSMVTVA